MPLVSVIMNIRNGAAFLRDAIDSVLAQSFTDWELIAWDDCSTDDSPRIVTGYSDPRIRYFRSPEETSLGKAREAAIRQARGEWLAFLDQDDLWTPTKLEQQVALAAPHVGIIYGRSVLFWPDGRKRDYDQAHEYCPLPEGDILNELFRSACFIAMSSAMLRRTAVWEIGGIPEHIEVAPDYYLYVAIASRYKARPVQDVVCWYRMHAGNTWYDSRLRLHQEAIALIDQWSAHLDPAIRKYRRMTHSTALALEEVRSVSSFSRGVKRLLKDGSVLWLISQPFVHLYRRLHRIFRRPCWMNNHPQQAPGSVI